MSTLRWTPSRYVWIAMLVSLAMWTCAGLAFAQERLPDPAARHYMKSTTTQTTEGLVRVEFHLLIGYERTASVVLGGLDTDPAPRYEVGISGVNEFEETSLCITIDVVWGPDIPQTLVGERACWVYDEEADTMAPINDPDSMVMGRAALPESEPEERSGT